MRKRLLIMLLIVTLVMTFSFNLSSTVVFADDSEDYIEIWDVDDLYMVRSDMSANYKLMRDIDMSEVVAEGGRYNYSGLGWEPFGATNKTVYSGTLDGNGHSITGFSSLGVVKIVSTCCWSFC